MKRTAILLFVLLFAVTGTTQLLSMQNSEDEKFQKLVDSYFDAYWKFYPTAGTLAGFNKYNDQLEDFDGVLGGIMSYSVAPLPSEKHHAPLVSALKDWFAEYQQGGKVRFVVTTNLWFGELKR